MAEKKERIKIVEVIRSTSSTKVTFSNGLNQALEIQKFLMIMAL